MEKPADAWWDEQAGEWVHGTRDAEGRLVGCVRGWTRDSVLVSEVEHVAGKPHGPARRFYPNGEVAEESTFVDGEYDGVRRFLRAAGMDLPQNLAQTPADVVAWECNYDRGDVIGMTWRLGDGTEVDQQGRPLRPRPARLPPTASPIGSDGWVFMRRRGLENGQMIELHEYYEDGATRSESYYLDGRCIGYYQNGQRKSEGVRNRTGSRHHQIGTWRHWDARGVLRMVSEYEAGVEQRRTWYREHAEAAGGGLTRSGPMTGRLETGHWVVRDDDIAMAEYDLGEAVTDDVLLAHAVTGAAFDDAWVTPPDADRSLVTVIARARHAGRARDPMLLRLSPTPAWLALADDGDPSPLAAKLPYDAKLVALVHALRWGPPDASVLAKLAAELFSHDRPEAALDVIDAALAIDTDPKWVNARAAYLRALERFDEAAIAQPGGLDERAFELLREIREHPDDDGPRLVYADHVAHTFPEHTALIVAQCAHEMDDEALVDAFVATLPEPLREFADSPERGFLELGYIPAEVFVEGDPDLLYRIAPTLTMLYLGYASGHIAQLVTMPALHRYTELVFTDTYLFDGRAAQLAGCPYLEQLTHLGLHSTSLHDEDLLAILQSTAYPRLEHLEIGNGREEQDYRIESFRALADAVFAPTLKQLGFERRWMGDDVMEVLAKLPALESLRMMGSRLTDYGAMALAELNVRLTELDLDHSEIGPEGAAILAASPVLSKLERLSIKATPIGDLGAMALASSRMLANVKHLGINGDDARVGTPFAAALAAGPMMRSLEHLDMSLASIGAAGAQAFASAEFPAIVSMNLHNNAVGDAGAIAIARSSWIHRIHSLDLSGCNLTNAGANALADVDGTHEDLWLELGGAMVSERTAARLSERFGDRVHLEYPWNRRR